MNLRYKGREFHSLLDIHTAQNKKRFISLPPVYMKNYELTYLITPDLAEEQVKEFQNKVVSFVQQEEGSLVGEGSFLRKKLAYPIKKRTQAYLAVLNFQLNPEKVANLEKNLKSEKQILRYLIIIKKKIKAGQKAPRTPLLHKKPLVSKIKKPEEKKIELKEIEKKLDEILNKD
ncbi:MAG: 30S ribosomal protein S6 [bacterium]